MFTIGFPRLDGELERMFNHLAAPRWAHVAEEQPTWCPAVDARDTAEAVILTMDVPGVKPEAIKLSVENGVLTIEGERNEPASDRPVTYLVAERSSGKFARQFKLPEDVLGDGIEARFDAGVLTVTLPKRPEVKPRTIEVKVA